MDIQSCVKRNTQMISENLLTFGRGTLNRVAISAKCIFRTSFSLIKSSTVGFVYNERGTEVIYIGLEDLCMSEIK